MEATAPRTARSLHRLALAAAARAAPVLWRMRSSTCKQGPRTGSPLQRNRRRGGETGGLPFQEPPYFFWGCGLPGSGFVPGPWHLNSPTGYAMDHTRLEDLKQKRFDRLTESERADFDEIYEAEKARHGTEYGK